MKKNKYISRLGQTQDKKTTPQNPAKNGDRSKNGGDITGISKVTGLDQASLTAVIMTILSCQGPVQPAESTEPMIDLAAPQPELVEAGSNWAELKWQKVEGALSYSIYFEGDEHPVMAIDTFAVLKGLQPSTEYSISMTSDPSSRSRYIKSGKSASISFSTTDMPSVDTVSLIMNGISTTSIAVSWDPVEKAGGYEYSFAPKDSTGTTTALDASQTELFFEDLTPGTTYRLMIRTIPSETYEKDYVHSEWMTRYISTAMPQRLSTPEVTVSRASSIHTEISWNAVENAVQYEYLLDPEGAFGEGWTPSTGEKMTVTDDMKAIFEGLAKNSEHDFVIRACPSDTVNYLDSEWAHVTFTAVNDFVPTLTLASAVKSHGKVTLGISAAAGEYYAAGIVPKAAFMDGEKADTSLIVGKIMEEISGRIDSLTAAGMAGSKAYASTLHEGNSSLDFPTAYGTTYVCYAYGIDLEGDPTGSLKYTEVKTDDFTSKIPDAPDYVVVRKADGSYSAENVPIAFEAYWTLNASYPTGVNYFKVSRPDSEKTVTEIKYANLIFNDAFKNKYGQSPEDGAEKLKEYFDASGTSLSASGITNINSAKAMTSSAKVEEGKTYVRAMRAVTAQADTVIAAIGVQAPSTGADWIHLSGTSDGRFTVKCDLPVTEGRTYCATLSASNNRPELLPAYLQGVSPTAITAARIQALNEGTGYSAKYTLVSGRTYTYIIQLTNAAGDTVCRSVAVSIE